MTRPPDDMPFVYRPIDEWPGEQTVKRRRSNYGGKWGYTLRLMERELAHIEAHTVVCQVALEARDFRVTDGHPRAQARASHPGVILAFESKYGPLKYATDTFETFPENFHAIALSLQRLRLVDECGVTRRGEQYRGWSALGPGTVMGAPMSKEEAARVLLDLSGEGYRRFIVREPGDEALALRALVLNRDEVTEAYRWAVKEHHPDHGGNADLFRRATEARDVLAGES